MPWYSHISWWIQEALHPGVYEAHLEAMHRERMKDPLYAAWWYSTPMGQLARALEAGYAPDASGVYPGTELKIESLEPVMRLVTYGTPAPPTRWQRLKRWVRGR